MAELRFDDRVAVITGGGRGLGRSYAELLAARGARVVVNDPGVGLKGETTTEGPADEVVNAIKASGGDAVANTDSVATSAGGKGIIETAMDNYGRIDILIHNAGIVRRSPLDEMSDEDFDSVLDVHLRGGFYVLRPAFAQMRKAGYGRIVMTASINALYGNAGVAGYSAAKAGLLGLTYNAAIEGEEHNIKSNAILPAAVTRMSEGVDTSQFPPMDPEMVAPAVGWLSHESCSVTGEIYISAAGRMARAFAAESVGVYQPQWTIESFAEHLDAIRSTDDQVIFSPAPAGHLDHLRYGFQMASKS